VISIQLGNKLIFDRETGESEHTLVHEDGEAEQCYRRLPASSLIGKLNVKRG